MKLSKNGRKTQKAIRRALTLGLPVAGLLLTAGCDRSGPKAKEPVGLEITGRAEEAFPRTIGEVRADKDDKSSDKFGGDFSTK